MIFAIADQHKYLAERHLQQQFNPASMAKLFYAYYLLSKYPLTDLYGKYRVTPRWRDLWNYRAGTVSPKLYPWGPLRGELNITTLIWEMLVNSCNISTGLVADFAGRGETNQFISEQLALANTSVTSPETGLTTTAHDLIEALQHIWHGTKLSTDARDFLLQAMRATERRAVIKNALSEDGDYRVYSKGGTTFNGERRDIAIIERGERVMFAVFAQQPVPTASVNLLTKLFARFSRGRLHHHLRELDENFGQQVASLLQTYVISD